ncbi:MAG: hypothetical protein JXR49_09170 [Acidobacteria bacterium]|nr:hypothetical protein [Acidobacteriota bacterium]
MKTTDNNEIDTALEQQLSEALKGQSDGANIAERVDKAVLAMADAKATQIRNARKIRATCVWRWSAAAAAMLLICAGLSLTLMQERIGEKGRLVHTTSQTDRTSPGDIVDVYILASKLAAGEKLSLEYDYNKDGNVDSADVNELARRAVSIEPTKVGKKAGHV